MAFIKQVFNLIGEKSKYTGMLDATEDMMFSSDDGLAYEKKLLNQQKKIEKTRTMVFKSSIASGISMATFVYNYTANTTRFGLRGQDIQDQLKLQDKMVNKAFGLLGVGLIGGPVAMAGALGATIVSELVSLSIQNKAYEYRKSIDEQQKAIVQERIGRAVYNSSRR